MQIKKSLFVFTFKDHSSGVEDSDFPGERRVGEGSGRLFALTSFSGKVQTDAASLNLRRSKV